MTLVQARAKHSYYARGTPRMDPLIRALIPHAS